MADVTDTAFRQLIAKYSRHGQPNGGPDVFWTEFVSINGLLSKGRDMLIRDLEYQTSEQPIVAQIFGNSPDKFAKVTKLCKDLGFSGVDINAGCPDKNICKQGAGSGMMHDLSLAKKCLRACLDTNTIPVSIKTRLGWSSDETDTWLAGLLEESPAVLTVHVRTKNDMSKTCPEWGRLKKVVQLKNHISPQTLIVANGGIRTLEAGHKIADYTGCDGIMMGKAIFGNPWLFDKEADHQKITVKQRLLAMAEHIDLFTKEMGDIGPSANKKTLTFGLQTEIAKTDVKGKSIALMKKHFKAYVYGFDGAKELREKLMNSTDLDEAKTIAQSWLKENQTLADTVPYGYYIV